VLSGHVITHFSFRVPGRVISNRVPSPSHAAVVEPVARLHGQSKDVEAVTLGQAPPGCREQRRSPGDLINGLISARLIGI